METLETRRLILRDFKMSDLKDFNEYASDIDVSKSSGWVSHKSLEYSKEILEGFIKKGDVYAIEYKQNHKVIGSIGVHNQGLDFSFSDKKEKCLGYALSKEYWSKGLMTEALLTVIDYCFNDLKVDMLWLSHIEGNESGQRLVRRLGFVFSHKYYKKLKEIKKTYVAKAYLLTKEEYNW